MTGNDGVHLVHVIVVVFMTGMTSLDNDLGYPSGTGGLALNSNPSVSPQVVGVKFSHATMKTF